MFCPSPQAGTKHEEGKISGGDCRLIGFLRRLIKDKSLFSILFQSVLDNIKVALIFGIGDCRILVIRQFALGKHLIFIPVFSLLQCDRIMIFDDNAL